MNDAVSPAGGGKPCAPANQAPAGGAVVALLGAECTGKSTLAPRLAAALQRRLGQPCTWVGEGLRAWCAQVGRTPRREEQAAIAAAQQARIEAAALTHAVVVADTTALMTALYSRVYFHDDSLVADAVAWQRGVALTLLAGPDLPWAADGFQRDGPVMRTQVDAALRALLRDHQLPWVDLHGQPPQRLRRAVAAVEGALNGGAAGPGRQARRGGRSGLPTPGGASRPC